MQRNERGQKCLTAFKVIMLCTVLAVRKSRLLVSALASFPILLFFPFGHRIYRCEFIKCIFLRSFFLLHLFFFEWGFKFCFLHIQLLCLSFYTDYSYSWPYRDLFQIHLFIFAFLFFLFSLSLFFFTFSSTPSFSPPSLFFLFLIHSFFTM